mmetsp:Transcript_13739/g.28946  ORF Transcript_13739/g.28946 Transcript_13739/m.28946 type:complete len:305 (-) Transcript_13739:1727-2641(-)
MSSTPVPAVAKFFLTLYHGIPTVNVPFTSFDISFSLLSAAFLSFCRFASEYVLQSSFGWPENATPTKEAASSCAAICHSMILCTGLIVAFLNQPYDVAAKIKDQVVNGTNWWPDLADCLLQFCTGYMIYDTAINYLLLRWNPETSMIELLDGDYLFLAHHMVTSIYMISARVIGAGYMSAMICMLLGEITNPLHNMYFIGEAAMALDCCNGPAAQLFHSWVTLLFAAAYFSFRAIIAPPFFAGVTYVLMFTAKGRANVPLPLNIFWNFLIWGVCFGSGGWIQKCYNILANAGSGNVIAEAQKEL